MKSLWNDAEAARCTSELQLRVYTSRLLGREPALVLHGGGNTSVKVRERMVTGEHEDILYVKGSGWDLETIEEAGFAPVRLAYVRKLAMLEVLSDPQMMNELTTQVIRAAAPAPSVETILHAILPHKFVDHTHADAVLAITNTAEGQRYVRDIYGDDVVIVPYIMPGFDLARLCAREFAAGAHSGTIGMVLMNHGVFSFGETARQSYERMIELVSRAESFLDTHAVARMPQFASHSKPVAEKSDPDGRSRAPRMRESMATLRAEVSRVAGAPMIMMTYDAAGVSRVRSPRRS